MIRFREANINCKVDSLVPEDGMADLAVSRMKITAYACFFAPANAGITWRNKLILLGFWLCACGGERIDNCSDEET